MALLKHNAPIEVSSTGRGVHLFKFLHPEGPSGQFTLYFW
jgi:hypothetical protein